MDRNIDIPSGGARTSSAIDTLPKGVQGRMLQLAGSEELCIIEIDAVLPLTKSYRRQHVQNVW